MSVKKDNGRNGYRSENVALAVKDYFLGKGNITQLAKAYNIDRSGLHRAIKSTETDKIHTNSTDLKTAITQTKDALFSSVDNLRALKTSENKIHNAIAEDLEDELKAYARDDFKLIRTLTKKSLVDFHKATEELRDKGEMDLDNINKSLLALRTANQIIGIPNKAPLVAIQNNIQNNTQTNNNKESDLKININVIQPPKKKKESEIIEVESE